MCFPHSDYFHYARVGLVLSVFCAMIVIFAFSGYDDDKYMDNVLDAG